MSVPESRAASAEAVAGYLAAAAIAASLVGIAYRPVRTIPVALLVALIAVALAGSGSHRRLATFAVMVGAIAFVVGMAVAVATDSALW